jgi:hypothetical protein
MFKLIFHPAADKEYAEAMIWYEQQKPGLGKRFEISVDSIIKKIQADPEFFGYSKKPFREASVVLFPYTIVFKINKRNQTLYIAAVYHTSRNPQKKYRD